MEPTLPHREPTPNWNYNLSYLLNSLIYGIEVRKMQTNKKASRLCKVYLCPLDNSLLVWTSKRKEYMSSRIEIFHKPVKLLSGKDAGCKFRYKEKDFLKITGKKRILVIGFQSKMKVVKFKAAIEHLKRINFQKNSILQISKETMNWQDLEAMSKITKYNYLCDLLDRLKLKSLQDDLTKVLNSIRLKQPVPLRFCVFFYLIKKLKVPDVPDIDKIAKKLETDSNFQQYTIFKKLQRFFELQTTKFCQLDFVNLFLNSPYNQIDLKPARISKFIIQEKSLIQNNNLCSKILSSLLIKSASHTCLMHNIGTVDNLKQKIRYLVKKDFRFMTVPLEKLESGQIIFETYQKLSTGETSQRSNSPNLQGTVSSLNNQMMNKNKNSQFDYKNILRFLISEHLSSTTFPLILNLQMDYSLNEEDKISVYEWLLDLVGPNLMRNPSQQLGLYKLGELRFKIIIYCEDDSSLSSSTPLDQVLSSSMRSLPQISSLSSQRQPQSSVIRNHDIEINESQYGEEEKDNDSQDSAIQILSRQSHRMNPATFNWMINLENNDLDFNKFHKVEVDTLQGNERKEMGDEKSLGLDDSLSFGEGDDQIVNPMGLGDEGINQIHKIPEMHFKKTPKSSLVKLTDKDKIEQSQDFLIRPKDVRSINVLNDKNRTVGMHYNDPSINEINQNKKINKRKYFTSCVSLKAMTINTQYFPSIISQKNRLFRLYNVVNLSKEIITDKEFIRDLISEKRMTRLDGGITPTLDQRASILMRALFSRINFIEIDPFLFQDSRNSNPKDESCISEFIDGLFYALNGESGFLDISIFKQFFQVSDSMAGPRIRNRSLHLSVQLLSVNLIADIARQRSPGSAKELAVKVILQCLEGKKSKSIVIVDCSKNRTILEVEDCKVSLLIPKDRLCLLSFEILDKEKKEILYRKGMLVEEVEEGTKSVFFSEKKFSYLMVSVKKRFFQQKIQLKISEIHLKTENNKQL